MKKLLSWILAASVLVYVSCHDMSKMDRDQFIAKKPTSELVVLTKGGKYYTFRENAYAIAGDSLRGTGAFIDNYRVTKYTGSIALADIDVVEVDQLNAVKTVLCVMGVAAVVGILVAVAMAESWHTQTTSTTTKSCPFIYTYDGKSYHLESETFAGAVLKGVERESYDNLRYLKPVDGSCRLKLANERPEAEYVDLVNILAVDHPRSASVIPDFRGTIHTLSHPEQPLACRDFSSRDVLGSIRAKDSICWESDLSSKNFEQAGDLTDGIVLEFARPAGSRIAKLVVNGMNTRLGEFAFTKLFRLSGDRKLFWYQQLEHDPSERAKFLSWMKREGMLHVKVWNGRQWHEQTALIDAGPEIAKDQVALLDLAGIEGTSLNVKLESTTDLWRIDQVSVDYSPDLPVTVTPMVPSTALNERGEDVAGLLTSSDDNYYVTVEGQHADITFTDVPRAEGLERSYVLRTKGFYYQWIEAHGPENARLRTRVLTEPAFGARMYLPEWKKSKTSYGALTE